MLGMCVTHRLAWLNHDENRDEVPRYCLVAQG